jgi:hypothetical protein
LSASFSWSLVTDWMLLWSTSLLFEFFIIVDFLGSHWACQKCVDVKIGSHLRTRHTWLPGL